MRRRVSSIVKMATSRMFQSLYHNGAYAALMVSSRPCKKHKMLIAVMEGPKPLLDLSAA